MKYANIKLKTLPDECALVFTRSAAVGRALNVAVNFLFVAASHHQTPLNQGFREGLDLA